MVHDKMVADDPPPQRHHQSTTSSSSNGGQPSYEQRFNAMPADEQEILVAFEEILKAMDLPPDKMRTLRNCDLKKKWDLVCDQRQFSNDHTVTDPSVYLTKLRIFMDKKEMKKKKKLLAGETSTTVLKHIEISLRTNTIDWVRQFLAPEEDGLRVLVDFISYLQDASFAVLVNADQQLLENGGSSASSTADGTSSLAGQQMAPPTYVHFSSSAASTATGGAESHPNGGATQSGTNLQQFFNSSGASLGSLHAGGAAAVAMCSSTYSNAGQGKDEKPSSSMFHRKAAKANGTIKGVAVEDDIHVGISCLRALLNNKFGVTAVFKHKQAIYCIVRAILHPSLKTKALALDILSGIGALSDGHELVLNAFTRFRSVYGELVRFQTLMHCFKSTSVNIDFLASCMKFINVLVHSTADMNQRVALQHEFTFLGLDRYIQEMMSEFMESDLLTHVNNYWDNCIDVELLHEKSIKCDEMEQEVAALQAECSRQKEEFQVLQADCYVQIAQLNAQLKKLSEEKVDLERQKASRDAKITTLTKDWRDRESKFEQERGELESRIALLEQAKREIQQSLKITQQAAAAASASSLKAEPKTPTGSSGNSEKQQTQENQSQKAVPPPPAPPPPANLFGQRTRLPQPQAVASSKAASSTTAPAPPPPPPPPPPGFAIGGNRPKPLGQKPVLTAGGGPPPPPPPIGLLAAMNNTAAAPELPKKRVAVTKNKLPMLNWSALNPNQVKGTVFNELDDEKLIDVLDLSKLEDLFGGDKPQSDPQQSQHSQLDGTDSMDSSRSVGGCGQPSPNSLASSAGGIGGALASNKTTLLGTKRLQNIAIIRRKLGKSVMEIMSGVHRFDLSVLGPDQVDILLPIVPTPEECTKMREWAAQHNGTFELLTLEDQFLAELMGIERLTQKLLLMKFMGDFEDSVKLLIPQLQKVTAAAKSVHSAKKFPKIMEIILAVGNAMNGTRRAPVYGFRMSSLDSLSILKSPKDRNITLLHCIVQLVAEKFPNLLDFVAELKLAESAATVNMETISADVRDIQAKFEQALAEQRRKGREESPALLNGFIDAAAEKINSLQENFKLAQEAFAECAEYFGEVPGRIQPDVFFTRIVSFCKHFEQARAENDAKRLAEQRQKDQEEMQQKRRSAQIQRRGGAAGGGNAPSGAKGQAALLDELNAKFIQCLNGSGGGGVGGANARQSALKSSKLDDGDFERIMVELKEGFVAPNGMTPMSASRRRNPSPNQQQRENLNSSREQQRTAE